ncbi:hypothetical protein PG987_011544 [Apiospora arundinis]
MSADAECFVIHPFQELVKIAKEAAANAEAGKSDDPERSQRMLKSARGLLKEGERALQKITPIWNAQIDRHGDAFKRSIRDNDVDVENRRVLEDLLYDLDDFIEVDTFDADKYSEVQAASKAFALSALEAIRRLKIEDDSPATPSSPEPVPPTIPPNSAFPPLPPLPPGRLESLSRPPTRQPIDSLLLSTSTSRNDSQRANSTRTGGSRSASGVSHLLERTNTKRSHASSATSSGSIRSSVSSRRSEHWPLHPNPLQPARSNPANDQSPPVQVDAGGREHSLPQNETAQPEIKHASSTPRISEWVREQLSTNLSDQTAVIPEDGTLLPHRHADRLPISRANRDTLQSSVISEDESATPTSPASTSYRTSVFSDTGSHLSTAKSSLHGSNDTPRIPPLPTHFFSVFPTPTPEIPPENESRLARHGDSVLDEPAKTVPRERVVDIPASEPEAIPWYADRVKCTIGPDSSFKALGGFCEGAFIFRESGGQAATIASLEQSNKVTVARCVECKYRHTLSEIEVDNNPKNGGLCTWGIKYRLRFLYKSHLPSESARITRYGCVFCLQEGRTPCESDATVFTTPDQLFRHLARHPQPLPEVDSFSVGYGETSPDDPTLGNFDLFFPNPPSRQPIGRAGSNIIRIITDRCCKHGPSWARILGVEFPEKWGGKQCTGWHDGAHGTFPAKCVSLLPPRKGNVRIPGINNDGVTVSARWKWEPSDPASGWLTFDKGATIRNVSWLNQDQWCWSGMTKDGKIGFFPQSHIKPESVKNALSPEFNQLKKQARPTRLFKLRRTLSHAS